MNWPKTSLLLIVVFVFAIAGCATYKRTSVEVGALDTYKSKMSTNGITVAAELIDNTEEAKDNFYVDVTEANFFPVLMIIQNDTSDRIYFLKESVEMTHPGGKYYRPVPSEVMADACEHNKLAYALLGFGIFSYMSADEANRKMASDWREKELPDTSITNPGRKRHGFLYFEFPEGETPGGSRLSFIIEKLETKEKFPFEILLPKTTFGSGLEEGGTPKISFKVNPEEPWTGVWSVEGSRIVGGIWGMKQSGRIVKSTGDSYYEFEGKASGNQLEGKILGDYGLSRDFVINISSDGLTFEGKSGTHHLKGKRKLEGMAVITPAKLNIFEPWTGTWEVESSGPYGGGVWELEQRGKIVMSTDSSLGDLNGNVNGNQLKGKIIRSNMIYPFAINISQDGLSFEGTLVGHANKTEWLKGKRKK